MSNQLRIIQLAAETWRDSWSRGSDVSCQTKKSIQTCRRWQELVKNEFREEFTSEKPIGKGRYEQKIDLVDETNRVAYELKVSENNVHMEIYRDVFKVLVHNRRNPGQPLTKLVFIAPTGGMSRLGQSFTDEVIAITETMGLGLELVEL